MFSNHPKVKFKILFSLFLAIIPFLLFIFILFDLWYDTRRTLILEQNLSTANLISNYLTKNVSDIIGLSRTLSAPEILDILQKSDYLSDKTKLKKVLKSISTQHNDISSVSFFDASGNLIESSVDYSSDKDALNISDREYFQEILSTKNTVVSPPLIGRLNNNKVILVASPVIVDGKLQQIAVVSIDVQKLKLFFENTLASKDRQVVIIDNEGNIVFILNQPLPEDSKKGILKNNLHLQIAHTGSKSTIDNEKLPFSDKNVLGYAFPAKINGSNWTVISTNTVEEAYLPIVKAQSFLWILILLSIIFAFTLISFFLRKIKIIY